MTKNIPDNAPEKERFEKVAEQTEKLKSIVAKFDDIHPGRRKKFSVQELNGLLEEPIEPFSKRLKKREYHSPGPCICRPYLSRQ